MCKGCKAQKEAVTSLIKEYIRLVECTSLIKSVVEDRKYQHSKKIWSIRTAALHVEFNTHVMKTSKV